VEPGRLEDARGEGLGRDRGVDRADKNLGYNLDMGFILVPPDQRRVPVKLLDYPKESDPGPYPVPDNAPIENWPLAVNEDERP